MGARALDTRVRRLERLVAGLAALLLLTLLAAFARQEGVPAELRARRIALVDAQGTVRAELAIDAEGSAGLFVRDDQGRARVMVIHDEGQSGLRVDDATGTTRLGSLHFAHGGTGYALHGPEGAGAAVLYLKESGALTFYGAEGEVLERIGTD